ncbi:MAG: ATP-binding cassette domain-containing protein [Dysgonamonadaceae bacterium]|jgi:phosphate transport system ATP-binding protein|nr:ATP-binding cassette domain-containing protein [Dysgonamonadaceae bacterium]
MANEYILELKNWSLSYSPGKDALKNITAGIYPNKVSFIIGPPESGKSAMLRSINRLYELAPGAKTRGEIRLNGRNIQTIPVSELRQKVGMIVIEPNVFSRMTVQENVLAGYTLNHLSLSIKEQKRITETYLRTVDLWEDVKNDLDRKPDFLCKGQQQCLCVARTLALQPKILLMDEPIAALEPLYAEKMENLIKQLKETMPILITSYNLSRTARMADYTLYLDNGELVEYGATSDIFLSPTDKRTEKYIAHRI